MVRRTLKLNDQIKQLAAELKEEQSCLMFGRGRNYATAMEAALKVWVVGVAAGGVGAGRQRAAPCATVHVGAPQQQARSLPKNARLSTPAPLHAPCPPPQVKEVSYMHSEGINAGEMKHGPLALVDDKLPIVVVSTMDSMHSKMAGVIQQVGSAGSP